jgi:hypothetical protein
MKIDIRYIILIFFIFSSCIENGSKESSRQSNSKPATKIPEINVYIENSGSMKGYLNGYSDFKNTLTNYLTDIALTRVTNSLNFYVINKNTQKINRDINSYIESLSSFSNEGTSDIALMFKNVLSKTNNKTVSIFVSDCIFSPDKSRNASDYLRQQQNDIKSAVATHLEKFPKTSITVYQMQSGFTGTYYNRDNKKTTLTNQKRPYYIWIIGKIEDIIALKQNVKESQIQGGGIIHSYTLSPKDNNKIHYAILKSPKVGDFERDKNFPKYSITDIKKGENKKGAKLFMFTVGINWDRYQTLLGNNYLTEKTSYEIETDGRPNADYQIDVQPFTGKATSFTHSLQLSTNKLYTCELNISLKNKPPNWVNEINDPEGLDVRKAMGKTFGIKHLIEGVSEAYHLKGYQSYETIILKLKK